MAYSKIKKILFILLCMFVLLFPFWCVRGLCAEVESVDVTTANLSINSSRNYFISSETGTVGYFNIEKGYIYHITNNSATSERLVVLSQNSPAVNVEYTILTSIPIGSSFDYIANQDTTMYISYGASSQSTITREKVASMDGVVGDLVENVGIQSLWNTFNDSVPFISIVVLFAFGLFIIIALIRKLRKGKGGI